MKGLQFEIVRLAAASPNLRAIRIYEWLRYGHKKHLKRQRTKKRNEPLPAVNPLFTIGHSTHDFAKFLGLLKQHEIQVVADVRSRPFSRFPWFNRPELKKALKENDIRYAFLGVELGARRDERESYVGPRADYDLISLTPAFRSGMERLQTGVQSYRVALMCSEREPLDCHRTVLVCRHAKPFAEISHIHADGHLESHEEAETRMMSRYRADEGDMFLSKIELLNEAYRRRGEEINYVDESQSSILREEPVNDEY